MTLSEDHTSCWDQIDPAVTTKRIWALLTAARASVGKDQCQVRLTGIERVYWMGTEISTGIRRLRLPRHSHSG